MAVTKQSDFKIGDSNLNGMMLSINGSYKAKADITLSNYDNDTAPAVKVGSEFDCNGGLYIVKTADETPSGYSGIANSTMFYLVFDESALSFVYTSTAPTWSDSFQGWYNGNDRYFFSMYKDSGGTLYNGKKDFVNEPWYFCLTGNHQDSEIYTFLNPLLSKPTISGNANIIEIGGYFSGDNATLLRRTFSDTTQLSIFRQLGSITNTTITSVSTTSRIMHIYSIRNLYDYNPSI